MQNFYEDKMNDILQDIQELEGTITSLKNVNNKPEVISAIRKIDDIIDRKREEFNKLEEQMQKEYIYGFSN